MTNLVIGGAGFIGSHTVKQLNKANEPTRVFTRAKAEELPGVEYIYGDYTNPIDLARALIGVSRVYHCLSTTVPGTSNLEPKYDVSTNLVSTLELLDLMRKNAIQRIVYISSGGTVYGNSSKQKLSETDEVNPICSYGIVKLAIEKYLRMHESLYDLKPIILRVSNPYGPGQKLNSGQGLVPAVIEKHRACQKITIWGNGSTIRDYIYIDDLVDLLVMAGNSQTTGIFNVGSGVGVSINNLLDSLEGITNQQPPRDYQATREFDVDRVVLDIAKVKENFDWQPSTPLIEGLRMQWCS